MKLKSVKKIKTFLSPNRPDQTFKAYMTEHMIHGHLSKHEFSAVLVPENDIERRYLALEVVGRDALRIFATLADPIVIGVTMSGRVLIGVFSRETPIKEHNSVYLEMNKYGDTFMRAVNLDIVKHAPIDQLPDRIFLGLEKRPRKSQFVRDILALRRL